MEELNNISIYGSQIEPLTFDNKFNIIKSIHEFKRATIYGSARSDELLLVDDADKGVYASYKDWMICDVDPVYEVDFTDPPTKKIESYIISSITSLEEYCSNHQQEVQEWFNNHIDIKEYATILKEKEKFNEKNQIIIMNSIFLNQNNLRLILKIKSVPKII